MSYPLLALLAVLVLIVASLQIVLAQPSDAVRIACIGNSITYGSGIEDRDQYSYPGQLGTMLGSFADVRNYGLGGRTLLKHGDLPYWNEREFADAKAFNPQIVIIKLGTNDSKPWNWKYASEFVTDYKALVDEFAALPSHPAIYLCYPVPVFIDNYGIRDSIVKNEIIPMVDTVAAAKHTHIIDLYHPLLPYPDMFVDGVHPNGGGANVIAVEIFKQLLGNRLFAGKFAPYKNPNISESDRTEDLLKRMSVEEKIKMLGGYSGFYIMPNARLGIPKIKMADGPLGVRNYGPSTAYPGGVCMAATWDTALERTVGMMVGREARSKGVQIMLAPGVNIQRAPMCGRNFEYFGEDPFLAGKMAASYVKGVQSQGVVATIKHFALNNEEYDRQTVSSDADERTMQEIYLPAFKAAVTEGHVGSVMCSYNLVNGEHAANSTHLLTDILKNQFKFDGFVMSDWGAVHDGVASATAGLDLEMWSGEHMTLDTLLPALKDGRITQAMIDDKIRRILRIMFRFGFFDRDQNVFNLEVSDGPDPRPDAHAAALQAAREGVVLLKNSGILPLDRSRVKQIAVIGPNAHPAVTGGGGSSHISPDHPVSVFDGISTLAGSGIAVNYLPGVVPVTDSVYSTSSFTAPDGKTPGLEGSYFSNQNLKGAPAFTQIDKHIKFDYHGDLRPGFSPGFPMQHFSVRWQGTLSVAHDDDYELIVAGDDGYRLFLDGKLIIDDWQDQGTTTTTASVHLIAGSPHAVTLEYYQGGGAANIAFGYQPVSAMLSPRVHDVAAQADAVVLCIGFNDGTEQEGADRTFELPAEQLRLIHEVTSANPHTIVVLNAGGNVAMTQWIDNVPALLHAWYPGQEGGTALAEIIFGDVNPSGKLPVSFEKRWEDNATYASYYADSTKHLKYSEGVFLGYRHFDQANIEPMFPFGFGLSYTTFQCANLAVASNENGGRNKIVTFDVTNTGARAGDEIEQVYVHQENSSEPRPPKELKGFVRVSLKPGETKTARLVLDESAFSYFSGKQNAWVVEPGQFQILVGPSSRAIALKKAITLN